MENYICIDVGGTSIKYGLADVSGDFSDKGVMPTEALTGGGAGILAKIKGIVGGYAATGDIQGVAISTAGMVDPAAGKIIHAAPHLIPGYTGMKLKAEVEAAFGFCCEVENDVNCAGLGEVWLGAGRGAASVFCLTVGTGIGGCVILDGKLVPGYGNSAGEIGYMHIAGGALQDLAATSGLVKQVAAVKNLPLETVHGRMIFAAAKEGDPQILTALDAMLLSLAEGIANVCYVLNPQVVILGGGIMEQAEFLRPRLETALQKKLIPSVYQNTRLAFAERQNDAGMLGALYNFLRRRKAV